jgi:hypothetical protein
MAERQCFVQETARDSLSPKFWMHEKAHRSGAHIRSAKTSAYPILGYQIVYTVNFPPAPKGYLVDPTQGLVSLAIKKLVANLRHCENGGETCKIVVCH